MHLVDRNSSLRSALAVGPEIFIQLSLRLIKKLIALLLVQGRIQQIGIQAEISAGKPRLLQ